MSLPIVIPGRTIEGMSAVFLPFLADGAIDWPGFETLLDRTISAGLVPAVNMDTGSTQFIADVDRARVLDVTAARGTRFVAGCFVADAEGDALDESAFKAAIADCVAAGATPVVFPCWGLNTLPEAELVPALDRLTQDTDGFIGFELGPQFVPYGRIYELATYESLVGLPRCLGAKHSSLSREAEWLRLAVRDRVRPEFRVYTGNDLAIDMVMYGSDYLLGLSAFAPERFAERDRYWAEQDPRFYELNDVLQYLGSFVFRDPVPGYKHDAAYYLALRGLIGSDRCPPGTPARPASDRDVLRLIAERLGD